MSETTETTPYRITTLKELGSVLPVGVLENEQLDKTLRTVPFKARHERELSGLRRKVTTGAEYASAILRMLVSQFGPFAFDDENTKRVTLTKAFLADVLYAYVYIRREALTNELPMPFVCPRCSGKNEDTVADLDTLEVKVIDDPASLYWDLELRDGLVVFGELRKRFKMCLPLWGAFAKQAMERKHRKRGEEDNDLHTLALFESSIIGVEGIEAPPVIHSDDVDEMSLYDLKLIEAEIGERHPGAMLVVDVQCKHCGTELSHPIEWNTSPFFSLPSLSQKKRI